MLVDVDGLYDASDGLYKSFRYADNAFVCYVNSDIPQDFQYVQDLRNIKKNIDYIKQQLKNHGGVLVQKRASYISAEKRNLNLMSGLEKRVASISINNTLSNNNTVQNVNLSGKNVQQLNTNVTPLMLEQLGLELDKNNKIQFIINQSEDYKNLQNSLVKMYNMKDAEEANKLLTIMCNNDNIKDYSIAVEKIVNHFDSNQQEFFKQFGFDMYRNNSNNEQILNTELIYSDVFLNINDSLIIKNSDGKNIVNPDIIKADPDTLIVEITNDNIIKSNESGIIDSYLRKKGI